MFVAFDLLSHKFFSFVKILFSWLFMPSFDSYRNFGIWICIDFRQNKFHFCILLIHSCRSYAPLKFAGASRGHVLLTNIFWWCGLDSIIPSYASVFIPLLYPWLIRKVFLVPYHIFQERIVLKLSNRSSQFTTRLSILKLKLCADWSTSPGMLCLHLLMYSVLFILELHTK